MLLNLFTTGTNLTQRIVDLFAAGEQGAWYDPSDFSTLFQDEAGTTPVTAVEQPVSRMLDKSGRGNHATTPAAASASRPTLSARVNLLLATATLSTQNVTTQALTYTLTFAGAGSITLSGTATGSYNAGTHSIVATAGTLTLTVSGAVNNADFRPANIGVGLPTYQRVTTSTDYDTIGFPHYLRFDGSDDYMLTGSINFSATDKMTILTGLRANSDATFQTICELSSNVNSNNSAFNLLKNNSASFGFQSKGTSLASANTSTIFASPLTSLITGIADISSDISALRVNGVQRATSGSDQGTGNFGNYPLYIGRRGGSSLPFNGRLYSLIVRGAQSTAAEITNAERYVNSKTKAY